MITKFSEFILQEGFAPAPSYSNTITNPITGLQWDPHTWMGNKCSNCGITRKMSHKIGDQKFYKYFDLFNKETKGMIECHSISKKFVPTSGPAVKVAKTGNELDIKPLPNMGLWDRYKRENKPTGVMRPKPSDLVSYLDMKRKFNLDYEFLMDSDDPEADLDQLGKLEELLSKLRIKLLDRYRDNEDWVQAIKKLD